MKKIQIISFSVIVLIIFLRGLFSNYFEIDGYTIALLFLLATPTLAPSRKEVKWFGTQFSFKDNIIELEDFAKKSSENIEHEEEL